MKTFALFLIVLLLAAKPLPAADDGQVSFSRQVLPILSDKCFVCHGPDSRDPDLVRFDSIEAATIDLGGYAALDPENPAASEILSRIHSEDDPMPPEDADKQLTDAERELLSRWILQGGQYSQHWAFIPPTREASEAGSQPAETARQAIDRFVKIQLAAAGLDFATPAARDVLARRAALVLTGLPPEPEQLRRYMADESPQAYEKLVDELLDSPRLGEHQARYWLDAVRYGDTHGLHLDNRRGIYPYRDWVVKAFNDNLPLDKFILWQLAGDLLPDPTLEQRVATGFVRLNPSTSEGGAIAEEFQAKYSFDRTETFGTVFLGLSMNCARCHTHKYDPISHTEYYRLMAFFNSTAEPAMDRNAYTYGAVARAPADEDAWREWGTIEAARAKLISEAEPALSKRKTAEHGPAEQDTVQLVKLTDGEQLDLLADPQGPLADWDLRVFAELTRNNYVKAEADFTTTLVAQELEQPRPTYLLERGEYDMPKGQPLEPGTPAVLGSFPSDAPRNRLGLAQWLTSRENPLTSRVLMNRIWQRVFGYGLVRTPEDFGVQGQQPTHPELLDWLAVELQEGGWNHKAMLREIVLSRTFQQSSARREGFQDTENKLLGRGPSYRLDAEVLRDLGLWSSSLLDPTMGGEGVKPYQPPGMWLAMAHPGSNTKNYERDEGAKLYRRSLYVYWKRTSPHPMMTLFDAPSRETSCVKRWPTNTSLQSLAMMNETQRVEIARMLAQRLLEDHKTDLERLDQLFELLACRKPTENERSVLTGLLASMQTRYEGDEVSAKQLLSYGDAPRNEKLNLAEHAAWTQVTTIVLASDSAILLY